MSRKPIINKRLNLERLPKHIAIILDGNGRWATRRGLPRKVGHKAGCDNLKKIMEHVYELGIYSVSLFLFSTENWKRPQDEIDNIFNIVNDYIDDGEKELVEKQVKVVVSGDYTKLPENLSNAIASIVEKTKDCNKRILNLAINYGGRDEIVRAVNLALKEKRESVTTQEFEKLLYAQELPPLDFVIRTSGEMRLSNFMLWQIAYSELYFTRTLWPDFSPKELERALIDYQRRKRRFGNI